MSRQLSYAATPHALFAALLDKSQPALLHSADTSNRFGRYDILSAEPVHQVKWTGGYLCVGKQKIATTDPMHALEQQQQQFCAQLSSARPSDAPFSAGFIGYFGYPLHQMLERQQRAPVDPTNLPDLQGGFYDWSIVTDHQQRTTTLYTNSEARQQQVLTWLEEAATQSHTHVFPSAPNLTPSGTHDQYNSAFAQIQKYLVTGDCYQVNLAQHFCAPFAGDPWQLYQLWCQQQGAPFNAYLGFSVPGDSPTALLSLSPERFLEIEDGCATVCPIKGTAARGSNAKQDQELAARLLANPKDVAENLMIVDLLRNDLGRICTTGSIEVTNLFELIKFSNVQHLVSTITGKLIPEASVMQVFKTLFPSGSITGAPKIRAIDIINEVEPVGRSVYCGSIGYWDRSGRFDSSVAIRTGVVSNGYAHLWGGGAIVADSQCAAELDEIQHKVGRMLTAGSSAEQ